MNSSPLYCKHWPCSCGAPVSYSNELVWAPQNNPGFIFMSFAGHLQKGVLFLWEGLYLNFCLNNPGPKKKIVFQVPKNTSNSPLTLRAICKLVQADIYHVFFVLKKSEHLWNLWFLCLNAIIFFACFSSNWQNLGFFLCFFPKFFFDFLIIFGLIQFPHFVTGFRLRRNLLSHVVFFAKELIICIFQGWKCDSHALMCIFCAFFFIFQNAHIPASFLPFVHFRIFLHIFFEAGIAHFPCA